MIRDIQIERNGEELVISIPWFRGISIPAAIFMALLTIVMTIYFFNVDEILCLIFPIFTGYVALVLILNRTIIIVNDRELVLQHGPFPTQFLKKTLSIDDITGLHITSKTETAEYGNIVSTIYQLHAKSKSFGRDIPLIKIRDKRTEILLVKSEIMRFIKFVTRQ